MTNTGTVELQKELVEELMHNLYLMEEGAQEDSWREHCGALMESVILSHGHSPQSQVSITRIVPSMKK